MDKPEQPESNGAPSQPASDQRIELTNKFSIQIDTPILIAFDTDQENIRTNIVGFSSEEFIILRLPTIPGIRNKILENPQITARYFSEGTIYGFRTSLLNFVNKPAPLMIISYPEYVEKYELRQYRRTECRIPASLYFAEGEYKGIIEDLSFGGCRMSFEQLKYSETQKIVQDLPLIIKFSLFAEQGKLELPGTIRSKTIHRNKLSVGIKFDGEEKLRQPIKQYLDEVESRT
jgi:hypothetical protein